MGWLSVIVGAVDELVVNVGIRLVKTGISLVADITGSLLGTDCPPRQSSRNKILKSTCRQYPNNRKEGRIEEN